MNPTNFPQSNTSFGPPPGMDESQVARIHVFVGRMQGGSLDGADVVITAWKPTPGD